MESGSTKLQSQRVRVDPCQGRQRHRRTAEQQPQHPPAGQFRPAQRHGGDESLVASLEVADHDPEAVARRSQRDLVCLIDRLERGDVHPLLESAGDGFATAPRASVQYIRGALTPRGVRHLGDDAVEASPRIVKEEERDRVEADAQVARVCEQTDCSLWSPAEAFQGQVPRALRQRTSFAGEIVVIAEAGRCGSARGPQGDRIEQLWELVEVEKGHEDAVTEGMRDGPGAAVRHPALVYGGGAHAASASSSGAGGKSGAAQAGSPGCGSGPRPPSLSATRSADQTPSSWNPQRQ